MHQDRRVKWVRRRDVNHDSTGGAGCVRKFAHFCCLRLNADILGKDRGLLNQWPKPTDYIETEPPGGSRSTKLDPHGLTGLSAYKISDS